MGSSSATRKRGGRLSCASVTRGRGLGSSSKLIAGVVIRLDSVGMVHGHAVVVDPQPPIRSTEGHAHIWWVSKVRLLMWSCP
jgi:hypothetical protein